MDNETKSAIGFLAFGLGFFLFVIYMIVRSEREAYDRRLNEAREFGFGGTHQHTVTTLGGKK